MALIGFAFLLLLTGNAAGEGLQYNTLKLSPLLRRSSPVRYSTLAAWPAGESTTAALHFRLHHRDAVVFSGGTLSPAAAFRGRLARDAARAEGIAASLAASGNDNNGTRKGGPVAPVISGLSQGSGEYFTSIGIGTPATNVLMVLDTGSDIVWLQCAPCRRCYAQSGPVFDPRKSRSYAAVNCTSPLCRRLDGGGCDTARQSCLYQVAYGDGSVTAGDLASETLTFSGGARVSRIALGCGHDNEGLFVAAAGLLGLGRGKLSFPSQIAPRYGRKFSYCLVDRTSNSGGPGDKSSSVIFGDAAMAAADVAAAAFTPMVRNPKMETFYYVNMVGVSVGGSRVSGIVESDLRLDPATGRGGVIVDSGTSVTRLARSAYSAVRDAFRSGAAGLRLAPGGFSLFDTCYDLAGKNEVKVPTVTIHLAGGAAVELPPENYLIPVDTRGTFCFAFAGTNSGVSIIGNIQQQGFRVVFDSEGQRLGFVPKGC